MSGSSGGDRTADGSAILSVYCTRPKKGDYLRYCRMECLVKRVNQNDTKYKRVPCTRQTTEDDMKPSNTHGAKQRSLDLPLHTVRTIYFVFQLDDYVPASQ